MAIDRFFIAPYDKNSGLQNDVRPWLVPDQAFSRMNNVYVWRGRVRKRFGSRWLGDTQQETRLRSTLANNGVLLGVTDGAGNLAGVVPGASGLVGQRFWIGNKFYQANALGTPVVLTELDPNAATPTKTFDTSTGAYTFAGAPALTSVYFYGSPYTPAGLGTTDGAGAATGVLPGASSSIGQMISIVTQIYTINALGAAVVLLNTGAGTFTLNTTTNYYTVTGAPALSAIYFYPALPVMGLILYDRDAINNEITIAFDTRYAYQYNGGWERLDGEVTAGASVWAGSNSQFFWGANYGGVDANNKVLYVTNFNQNEKMRYLFNNLWNYFFPRISDTSSGATLNINLQSARLLVPFKNRLVAFNVWEAQDSGGPVTLQQYPFRARWCAVGDPTATNAWRQDIPGQGSGRDAPVNQAIITCEFVKDRLVVYFEDSTWEFVYTANQIYPFDWQQINTELGAESTFSIIPLATVAIGVGQNGIHQCNGTNVERIDSDIPDEVFNIHNTQSGPERVYGIRDFFVEMLYWTFPATDATPEFPYPNRVLVYNYKTQTWAFNDDSITAFGYFFPQPVGITWNSQIVTWDDDIAWNSGEAGALFKNVIAGNQEGWTFVIDANATTNAPALQITDMTVNVLTPNVITFTVVDHNLRPSDFIYFESITGTGNLTLFNNRIFKIEEQPTQNTFVITYFDPTNPVVVINGVYSGGGTIARVSQIDFDTKEFNFYAKEGRNLNIFEMDFQVDATSSGEVSIDYYVSTSQQSMLTASSPNQSNSIVGTGILETFPYNTLESAATRLVHPVYIQADGEFIQLNIYMDDDQMQEVIRIDNGSGIISYTGPTFVDFQMHSICFYAKKSSTRMRS